MHSCPTWYIAHGDGNHEIQLCKRNTIRINQQKYVDASLKVQMAVNQQHTLHTREGTLKGSMGNDIHYEPQLSPRPSISSITKE